MGFVPDEPIDALWYLVAPITTIPTAVYAASSMVTGDWVFGKPDWQANLRNSFLWTATAASVYGWNLLVSPHNASWVSGGQAFRTAGQIATSAPAALPIAVAVAYVAAPLALYGLNKKIIESAPEEDQQSFWRVFATGLTGSGPGIGTAGR